MAQALGVAGGGGGAVGEPFAGYGFFTTHDNLSIRYAHKHSGAGEKRGSVVLLGGRKEFIEKYEETAGELNLRGYDVYAVDWRGQGLSSRMLENRHKGHVEDYGDYIRDLRHYYRAHVKPFAKGPIHLMAHSMGGHISLRYLREHPGDFQCAVLTAPMVDIETFPPLPGKVARFITARGVKGDGRVSYAVGFGDYNPERVRFAGNRLTSDPGRFRDEITKIRENPDLALGGVTYGWLDASFRSIDILTNPDYVQKIETPVLMCSAEKDKVVDNRAQKRLCRDLPKARFVSIKGARHEILKEKDHIRRDFWDAFDGFIPGVSKR